MSTSSSREAGRSMIRSATGMVVVGAVVGTASLAFYVGHAYGGTTGAGSSAGSSSKAPSQGYGDQGQQYYSGGGDDGFRNAYGDPYGDQGQQYQGGYAPGPGAGGPPQAGTGGS